MTIYSNQNSDIKIANEKLGQAFYANGRYNPLFLMVSGLGFIVIYILTIFNLLGEPAPQVLYIGLAVLLTALLQVPAVNLARRNQGIAANFVGAFSITILAVLLTAFWQGIVYIAILAILITPLTAIWAGLPRRYWGWMFLLAAAGVLGSLAVNVNSPIERLQSSTIAAITSLAFLGTIGLLLVTITLIARSKGYRSLRTQLLTSFIIIVTIPTLLAIVLSAVGAYVNNETQTLNILKTITNLKENQINAVINKFGLDAERLSQDADIYRNALNILVPGKADSLVLDLSRSFARRSFQDFLKFDQSYYKEILLLNVRGGVVVSTEPNREGLSFQSELFYRQGSLGNFIGFAKNPLFGDSNNSMVYSVPIYDTDGQTLRGILVLRANANLIKDIMENTPGFPEMESYLLDKNFYPITKTRRIAETIHTPASDSILSGNNADGRGTYENYAGDIVVGYYKKMTTPDAVFIAEVPRSYILQSSVKSLLTSSALAAFAIIIAVAAVAISAASISEPISALAKTTENFAAGKLSARAKLDRRDEIGALGNAYDQMAAQLQDIIDKLEQRVTDRTKELEDQTLRLRTSAEIARDAASAHNLEELLDRSGTLIQERFGLYHTGIFLLDKNHEYAILAASPTEAGKKMIANGHQLRVGEIGIVGRVAATGEARISLDTGSDAVHFNNPFLPNTHSEMALPLKVENNLIGVLDVQSDQPQAFDANDVAIMQILADQLATAIERTRLLQQVEQNLSDLEQAYGQFTREGWKTLSESSLLSKTGYRFDNVRIQPITEISDSGNEALQTGNVVMHNHTSGNNQVAIPIKLRGQTIGVVAANLKDGYTQTTISTLQLAIERLALSLESARLYEEARQRADREQAIAQVATNISSASEFDAILRTTVEEVGKVLGDSEVSIQILSNSEQADK
jgi:GAF domain-containing protein/HAMP domain-containing protein